jgi:hypothetical protein
LGHSYAEIATATGYSSTKVNRCLTEGRKSFLERFEGIEAGEECERWQPVLSAMVDGEATAAQITEARPHLRNCPACRATLRGLHQTQRPLAAVLPVGLVSGGAKLSGLLERLVAGVGGGGPDAGGAAAGGAGFLGVGGAKLAGLLAAGAAATAGGGLIVAQERGEPAQPAASGATRVVVAAKPVAAVAQPRAVPAPVRAERPASAAATSSRSAKRPRVVARRHAVTGRVEFTPRGVEPTPITARGTPAAVRASAPSPASPAAVTGGPDHTRGEFAPQP